MQICGNFEGFFLRKRKVTRWRTSHHLDYPTKSAAWFFCWTFLGGKTNLNTIQLVNNWSIHCVSIHCLAAPWLSSLYKFREWYCPLVEWLEWINSEFEIWNNQHFIRMSLDFLILPSIFFTLTHLTQPKPPNPLKPPNPPNQPNPTQPWVLPVGFSPRPPGLISMLANFRRPTSSVFGLFTQPEVREVVYEAGEKTPPSFAA